MAWLQGVRLCEKQGYLGSIPLRGSPLSSKVVVCGLDAGVILVVTV